jgi:putative flippase GtrA
MRQGAERFLKYSAVGVGTFLFDLGMLYIAVSTLHFPVYISTPITFLIAVSCNYVLSRKFIFKETTRGWSYGYAYFAAVAIGGAFITTLLVTGLVTYLGLYYIIARIAVAGIIGVLNYLFNLYLNFKVAGNHTSTL